LLTFPGWSGCLRQPLGPRLLCYYRKRGRVLSTFPCQHPALWYAAELNGASRSLSCEKHLQLSIWDLQGHPLLPGLVEKQVADQLAVVLRPYLTEIDRWEWLYPSALETDAKLFSQLTVLWKREGRSVLPAVSIRNRHAVHSGRSDYPIACWLFRAILANREM
jgi:hypothetical protein